MPFFSSSRSSPRYGPRSTPCDISFRRDWGWRDWGQLGRGAYLAQESNGDYKMSPPVITINHKIVLDFRHELIRICPLSAVGGRFGPRIFFFGSSSLIFLVKKRFKKVSLGSDAGQDVIRNASGSRKTPVRVGSDRGQPCVKYNALRKIRLALAT